MELKVWVDGIQRVVCGANVYTTCQDVVVALAHAMGRTGRFTLIEKWRDVERPLTPAECPLKSLHKWGEYAAEVRFYLMQAEQQQQVDKPPQKSQKQRSAQMAEMEGEDSFSHNFSPPPTQQQSSSSSLSLLSSSQQPISLSSSLSSNSKHHHQYQNHQQISQAISQSATGPPEAVKRSSTFSGTLNSNYASPSSSLHSKLDSLKEQQQQKQPQQQQMQHNTRQRSRTPKQQQQQHQNKSSSLPPYQQQQLFSNNTPQQYQNVPGSGKPLQPGGGGGGGGNTSINQSAHPPPYPQKPNTNNNIRLNGNQSSSRSSASSSNSSPRNNNSLSPGWYNGPNTASTPSPNNISSSPRQDSRHLHPANIPKPSETYSNFPSSPNPARHNNSRDSNNKEGVTATTTTTRPNLNSNSSSDQHQTQQQQRMKQSSGANSNSSPLTSTTRPVPTPAPRNQHRQLSPSSHPYENFPPRRSTQYLETSSSSLPPADDKNKNWTNGPPPPQQPSRNRRRRTELEQSNQLAINNFENDNAQRKVREIPGNIDNSNTNTFIAPQNVESHSSRRGGEKYPNNNQVHDDSNKFINKRQISNNLANNDHNFNSDLSDDCFQGPDPQFVKYPHSPSANVKNDANHSNDSKISSPPRSSSSSKIRQMFPSPQISQNLPSHSSNRVRIPGDNGQRMTKSQTLPTTPTSLTPERTRRSEGGRVNFVESAMLRQQRSSSNPNTDANPNINKSSDSAASFVTEGKRLRDSSRDRNRRPSGEHYSHSITTSTAATATDKTSSSSSFFRINNEGGEEISHDSVFPEPSVSNSQSLAGQYSNNNDTNITKNKYYVEKNNNDFVDSVTLPNVIHPSSSPSEYNIHQHQQQQQRSPRTSAFKVVSPRSNHSNSSTKTHSPISPTTLDPPIIAYNLDNQNFDLPVNLDPQHVQHHHHHPRHHSSSSLSNNPDFPLPSSTSDPRPHSRQASLEVEEYDLDQNFPDLSQKDGHYHRHNHPHHHHNYPHPQTSSSTLPRVTGRKSVEGMTFDKQGQGHIQGQGQYTEYVMDGPSSGGASNPNTSTPSTSLDPEYMRVLRQVKMQQEQLRVLEAQVKEMDTELTILEADHSSLDLKLDVIGTELSSLEKEETKNREELEEMEGVEWVNVLDGEVKCQQHLRSQMSKQRQELTALESKLVDLNQEEKSKMDALTQEKQYWEDKEKEEQQQTLEDLTKAQNDLSTLEDSIGQGEEEVKVLDNGIKDTDDQITSQKEEADRLEKLLCSENMKEFKAYPVPKEPPPPSSTHPTTTTSIATDMDNNNIVKVPKWGQQQQQPPHPMDNDNNHHHKQEEQQAPPPPTTPTAMTSSSSRPTTPRSRPPSETGEAILKILEGHLSPRPPPSSTTKEVDGSSDGGNTTTLQNPLKAPSSTLVKNPNGVWV